LPSSLARIVGVENCFLFVIQNYKVAVKRTFSSKLGLPYNDCIKNVTDLESFDSELSRFLNRVNLNLI